MGRGGYFYKILPARDWRAAESSGVVPYAAVDERDGSALAPAPSQRPVAQGGDVS